MKNISLVIKNTQRKIFRAEQFNLFCVILLLSSVFILMLFGLVMLYSTVMWKENGITIVYKQTYWIIVGIFSASAVNLVGYKKISHHSEAFIIVSCALLFAVLFSKPINGAYRWISLPFGIGNIQPSEFAKLSIIMFLAKQYSKNLRTLKYSWKALFYPISICAVTALLIILEGDLGTTALLCFIIWFMTFAAGIRVWFLILSLPIIKAVPIIIKYTSKVRWARMTSYLEPEKYQATTGYQLWLSILALGSGSWTGRGFAHSRLKANYLPEAHTDFILSIIGEELGYLAIVTIIALYGLILILGTIISIRAKDRNAMLLGFGITVMISLQALINIGVISGALPTKGMPAPFISYGGSNLIVCLTGVGLLMSIANFNEEIRCYNSSRSKNNKNFHISRNIEGIDLKPQ